MPMQWTAENDNILFLKVLETNNISVNYNAIAEAWPVENGKDKPTPRAISERIFRLKQKAKQKGVSVSAPSTPASGLATPRARGSARGGRSGGGGSAAAKRKKQLTPDEDSESEVSTPKRVKKEVQEVTVSDLKALQVSTPSKRSRKPVQYLNMAAYADSENDANDSCDSLDADFNPDEVPTYCADEEYHHAIITEMTDGNDA
ncbi:uncharacterized protein TRUGW13939_09583 [Talaromyces rugulosus]|uniref:Uncharacterized protein n=1 Tax=Talaromyces rugulosus TaxID=121627 RepID=A0A7H8R7Q4_TALRU|nr:uncharacterized protein TRUGW13939_09583 [Talaromyces rugulosus]QKX62422.1 hypothetical protein TRUGW13939_09583 [Talaromyces rugulosus]